MAKKAACREYLILRRRYADVIVRYRALTSSLQVALETISYNNDLMKNPELTEFVKSTIRSRNKGIDRIIGLLANPHYICDKHEVDRVEQSLLWHEARFLSVAEAAQLDTWPTYKETDENRPKAREFCGAYLQLNQKLIERLDAISASGWFSPRDTKASDKINACVTKTRAQFNENILRAQEKLNMPCLTADKEELMKWAVQLRFTLRRYTEEVLDSLTIAPPIQSAIHPVMTTCKRSDRYAACVVGYRRLAANLIDPNAVRIGYASRYPEFHQRFLARIAEVNAHTDAIIMALAEIDKPHSDTAIRKMEQTLFLHETILLSLTEVSQLRPAYKLYKASQEDPELNRAYCIGHVKLANLLLHRLMLLCTNAHIAPIVPKSANEIKQSIAAVRTALEAHIRRAADALSSPIFAISRQDVGTIWHNEIVDIAVRFAEEISWKLRYRGSPNIGTSLWEQAASLTPVLAENEMVVVSSMENDEVVRILH